MTKTAHKGRALWLAVSVGLALGLTSPAFAVDAANDWPRQPFAATSGDFGVVQVATTDPARFIRDLSKPGAGAHLHVEHAVRRDKGIDVFVSFRGCRGDRHGTCRVSGDFKVIGPSGATFARQRVQVWPGLPKPKLGVVSIGQERVSLVFKGDDPVGNYRVVGVITDENSKRSLRTVQTIKVVD